MFWPAVSIHVQQSRAPLVLSASHTSTVAEQLLSVLAVMQSLPHTRHVVTQLIVDQLDSITSLVSSPASLPAVSLSHRLELSHSVSGGRDDGVELIIDQLDSITSLVSSPASQPAVSLSLTVLNCHIVSVEVVVMELS